MEMFLNGLVAVLGIVAFWGGIALVQWVDQRDKIRRRDLEHTERMKGLEQGHPLPDAELAWAAVARSRTCAAGAVAIIVPLVACMAAVGGTSLVLQNAEMRYQVPMICTIWGVVGALCIVTVSVCIGGLRRLPPRPETSRAIEPVSDQRPVEREHTVRVG